MKSNVPWNTIFIGHLISAYRINGTDGANISFERSSKYIEIGFTNTAS